jgi:hypothetical protein
VRGTDILDQFVESLPVSVREKLERYAKSKKKEMLLQTQIVSEMEQLPGGGYVVKLRALENDAAVMELSLRVATRDMAQRMRGNWEKQSESLYQIILEKLLKNV